MIQEKFLQFVPVGFHNPAGQEFSFFLVTSPEVGLKKLLAAGFEKIFQITPVFRDYEDFGHTHNIEFLMLEWYRAPGNLKMIMDDTEKLVKFVAKKIKAKKIVIDGKTVDLMPAWDRISMKDLWKKYLDIDLDEYLVVETMTGLAQTLGYDIAEGEEYENVFYKIFLNKIEPHLGWERPVMVYDYPLPMSALCQLNKDDPRYVERMELYIGGLELSNAYGELIDKDEQKRRMKENYNFRKKNNLVLSEIDEDFNEAVGRMKPAGGIALGVDRLVMLLTEAKDINEVIFESVADQVER
jgi:lysyl-tRNA synthetase class 2